MSFFFRKIRISSISLIFIISFRYFPRRKKEQEDTLYFSRKNYNDMIIVFELDLPIFKKIHTFFDILHLQFRPSHCFDTPRISFLYNRQKNPYYFHDIVLFSGQSCTRNNRNNKLCSTISNETPSFRISFHRRESSIEVELCYLQFCQEYLPAINRISRVSLC